MRAKKKIFFLLFFALFFSISTTASSKSILVKGGEFTPLYGTYLQPTKISDFLMDEWPVTNREFLDFVKRNSQWQKSKVKKIFADNSYLQHWKSDLILGSNALSDGPVVSVSWFAAKAYCESKGKRLATVNEWEYVASRPIKNHDIKKLILDWYSIPTPERMPSVSSGLKNSTGIASLHGLIWEWTLDFNSTMVTGESRADGSLDKSLYCGAGSSGASDKTDYAAFMRFGFRTSLKANYTVKNLGFRCVKDYK